MSAEDGIPPLGAEDFYQPGCRYRTRKPPAISDMALGDAMDALREARYLLAHALPVLQDHAAESLETLHNLDRLTERIEDLGLLHAQRAGRLAFVIEKFLALPPLHDEGWSGA